METQGVAVRDGARAMGVWLIATAGLVGLGRAWKGVEGRGRPWVAASLC